MLYPKIQKATYFNKESNQQTIPATFVLSVCSMNMVIPLQIAVSILNIQKWIKLQVMFSIYNFNEEDGTSYT
jgi:hypothetical protein